MHSFESDYTTGAHEKILRRLAETNLEQTPGYGFDPYCESAKKKIRLACQCPEAEIFFLVGGTQTNAVVIDSVLEPYAGVIAAHTGHISDHEAGAIEFTGHKVIEIPAHDGKIDAQELSRQLQEFWQDPNHTHMVYPGMVYLSHPTEFGTLYSARELVEIAGVCKWYDLPLYIDGARLGYGLMCAETDVTLPMIAKYADVFYIGGTKVGALFGEAVVFTKHNMPRRFPTIVKQHGALLAKGRILGLQFDTLFTDGLYFELGRHAVEMAQQVKQAFQVRGYPFYLDSPTNLQFILMEVREVERLQQKIRFSIWGKPDEVHRVARFATSWSTTQADVDALVAALG